MPSEKLFLTITNKEAALWQKLLVKSEDPEGFVEDIILIDQALTLQKNRALLTKKRGLKKDLENLIAKSCGETSLNLSPC